MKLARNAVALLAAITLVGSALAAQDLSDAPSPYPQFTFFNSSQSGYRLDCMGVGVSDDMSHGASWTQDSDDDGIEFLNMQKGGTATLKVAIVQSYNNDDLCIWMDFNNDGDWLDAGERVVWAGKSSSAPNGAFSATVQPPYGGSGTSFNTYVINIPAGAAGTSVKVRAVLWDATTVATGPMSLNGGGHPGGVTGTGFADWGEVEDHDVPYATSTGSKFEVYESDGSLVGNKISSGGTYNLGNLTAGVQKNVFYCLTNNKTASYFVYFTTAYPNPAITASNLVNCSVNMAIVPGNGLTISPNGGFFTCIAMVTPTTAGSAFSFRITAPTNDPVTPNYIVNCQGNATAPAPNMELHRPTYTQIPHNGTDSLGTVAAGNAQNLTYTIFNNGSANLNLTGNPMVQLGTSTNCTASVTSQPPVSTLQGGGWSMTFALTLTPTSTGQFFSVVLTIPSNETGKNPYTITISGTAGSSSGSPEIDLLRGASIASGGTDNVGSATAAVQSTLNYTISNAAGTAALNLTGSPVVQISGLSNASASVAAQPANSVAAGASVNFTVNYTPGSGTFSFVITIANNDANENPYIINVTGNGVATSAPEVDLLRSGTGIADGATDNLGTLPAGTASGFGYTISNTGNAPLTLGSVVVGTQSNCTVTVSPQPGTSVAAGSSTTFGISVTPTAAGAFSAQLSFTNNDPNENPYDFTVAGNGQANAPDISVARPVGTVITGSENLGATAFGTPLVLTYTISNTGTQTLNLTGVPAVVVAALGNCTVSVSQQPAGTAIPAGSSVTFQVSLTVTTAAAFSFSVSIDNNVAGKSPLTWTANGTGGTLPEVDIQRLTGVSISNGGSLNLGTLPFGTSTQIGFLVLNTGNATLNLTGSPRVAISGQSNIIVTVNTQPGAAIAPGSSGAFNITYSIPAAGPFSVNVTVLNDDADEGSYTYTITGTGGSALFGTGNGSGGGGGGCVAQGHAGDWNLLVLGTLLLAGGLIWRRKGALRG
ncbi:MAG: choice-of-anchor D domain-containing protein [Planctomycetes bacterium]|nr:choice-of-anchor D domain-containing protein [Planctomycetota bacterium]